MAEWTGDRAYLRLVERHGTALLRLAYLLTGNRFDAEDVVQDVLISVAAKWLIVRPTPGYAYLKRAVANRAVDIIRKRHDVTMGQLPESLIEETGYLKHEQDENFFALVRDLPPRQRETLILRFCFDLDDRAIARLLDVTAETVRSNARRAIGKLRATELDRSRKERA
jgi:RNA polymerase sigma factor (sigma-70 family)